MQTLKNYYWPGNVRELANVIERALINSNGTVLQLADKLDSNVVVPINGDRDHNRQSKLEDVERDHILAVLEACEWRIEGSNAAAEILGLNSSTLRKPHEQARHKTAKTSILRSLSLPSS